LEELNKNSPSETKSKQVLTKASERTGIKESYVQRESKEEITRERKIFKKIIITKSK